MYQQRRRRPAPVQRSLEEWQGIVDEYEACTTPQLQFCAERGVTRGQLQYWRSRILAESSTGGSCDVVADTAADDVLVDFLEFPLAAPKAPAQAPKPVPLPAPSGDGHWRVELDLGGGLVLRVR